MNKRTKQTEPKWKFYDLAGGKYFILSGCRSLSLNEVKAVNIEMTGQPCETASCPRVRDRPKRMILTSSHPTPKYFLSYQSVQVQGVPLELTWLSR